ncbi:sensor histidine kinase [Rhizorhabdus histidinilytica]|jgi:two-component sensor histidine kinase|uniref:histidine kinase n=1 Tax=Rhizorhabdus histidinilytica TaxID=439228 RepID=A0A1T5BQJ2_9SPHN|nr:histidine kinase dimerization/phosphoacceptor domain -containing protein [Rhizorhabdus histidinilytica]SKB49425.1 Two-component sensor histidine kinase, contains HisKA and HATPase domains [Rhizorhabdus histidinilytica]
MGAGAISAILDLPHRLAGRKPDLATDVVVATAGVGLAVAGRLIVDIFAPGVLAYSFVFPAVIFSCLIAGLRSGLIVTVICQLLIWYFVIPPQRDFAIDFPHGVGLFVATASLLLTAWVVAGFRAAAFRLREEQQRHVELLSLALREVDHRTRNNFQIAASLLLSRAAGQDNPELRGELQAAAGRLQSLASVYSNLALSSTNLSTVMLHEHLREICERIRDGMLPAGVTLSVDAEPIEVPAQTAVSIALIVNECLTNAAKHAFPEGVGAVAVWLRPDAEGNILVTIEDDGAGHNPDRSHGTGSKLMDMLARSLGAELQISSGTTIDRGTRCELKVPHGSLAHG